MDCGPGYVFAKARAQLERDVFQSCIAPEFGLGASSQHVVHDFEIHGPAALDTVSLGSAGDAKYWRDYFNTALGGIPRICISIGATCFASLAIILVLYTTISSRMTIPAVILVPLETLCMCAMAMAFGTSLSFAASLSTFKEDQLAEVASSDLARYVALVPLSKGMSVLTCIGWFLTLVVCIIATVDTCNGARARENCSFRPTASALGMSPRYPDIAPQMVRSRVPTMYDPRRPLHVESKKAYSDSDEESAKLIRGGEQTYRDSALTEEGRSSLELEREFMGLLSVDKPEKALQLRPKRPWSESPMGRKKYDDDVQSM
ncbi:hypothetical protein T440DRAFT_557987 [Plenodomus tracheiphilus IPT5]|uniref:Uncharacterized protein n=1 Tax=Plenodomus tracheiphilus IPT5 TaxID=1408161 RepID=A0A6A7AX75_9PLEO|nr:hypothetical protein T440DRAFT_557987 [Plenodomus tracheiphilus IPT5]